MLRVSSLALILAFTGACKQRDDSAALRSEEATPAAGAPRLEAQSPWFPVADGDVGLHLSFSGFKPNGASTTDGERVHRLAIGKKALAMVDAARTTIVASAFLFDSMYASNPEGTTRADDALAEERRITETFRDRLLAKRRENPNMLIVVVLDPINRAYADRVSEAVKRFHEAGIDVFYSDLASTPPVGVNNKVMSAFQELHRRDVQVDELQSSAFATIEDAINDSSTLAFALGDRKLPIQQQLQSLKAGRPLELGGKPVALDGHPLTLELAFQAALLKANHRKLLVTDAGDRLEALVSSANPHNASFGAANSALSVKGAAATYIYNVIREDVRFSIERQERVERKLATDGERAARAGKRFAFWSAARATPAARADYLTRLFPALPVPAAAGTTVGQAAFVTESKIADAVLSLLARAERGDEIRIQMFYLSYQPVIDAILAASKRTERPVRVLLDPNKDAFNAIKDGTPNRQVARHMLRAAKDDPAAKLELRWYSTHGEQNHAKIMSITNAASGKHEVITGSCNWTGKNIAGPNMEANLVVKGAPGVVAQFNAQFDAFWSNRGEAGVEYSIPYDDPRYRYHEQTADDASWLNGESTGLVAW